MNLRNVLSAYSKLRQLTDDESALLETLRGLNDAERESLVVALQPEKMAGKRAGVNSSLRCKAELLDGSTCHMVKTHSIHAADNKEPNAHKFLPKKSSKGGSKSARASEIAATIKDNLDQQRATKNGACTFVLDNGTICNTGDNNPIHDKSFGYAGYHEFQSAPVAHEAGAGG